MSNVQPLAIFLILLFLAVLFTALGTVAGDFFSVNLSSIARGLCMNDTLAGVTLLALGNGSPDIFSTFAAMKDNSSSMAIGELIGAASFITAVVAGSMALVRPFTVVKSSLIRDILALMFTAVFLTFIMTSRRLQLWHCICMLSFYVMYVVLIMAWHWWIWKHPSAGLEDDEDADVDENASPRDGLETSPLLHANGRRQSVSYASLRRRSSVSAYPPDKLDDNSSFPHEIYKVLFPTLQNTTNLNTFEWMAALFRAPIIFLIHITLPVVHEEDDDPHDACGDHNRPWHRWLLVLQIYAAPQFLLLIARFNELLTQSEYQHLTLYLLLASTILTGVLFLTTTPDTRPPWFTALCAIGFVISIAWISTIADEVVSILQALGIICNVSEGILGITVFAIGNSLEDLVANISVARNGHPVMALSACFGGPLLNILLGIGGSGILLIAKNKGRPVHLHATRSLYITLGVLVGTLMVLLGAMIWTRWRMTKGVGVLLLSIWGVGTVVNVFVKVVG